MSKCIPYEDIQPGDTAEMRVFISEKEVKEFSELIGDHDSFHVSEEAARQTPFKKPICHGIHLSAYISKLLGTELPGFGSIYLEQNLIFKQPVYMNECILLRVEVLEKLGKRRLKMKTSVYNVGRELVIDGEAIVLCHR